MTEIEKIAFKFYPRDPKDDSVLAKGETRNMYAYHQMKKRRIFITGANQMKEIALRAASTAIGTSGVNDLTEDIVAAIGREIDKEL